MVSFDHLISLSLSLSSALSFIHLQDAFGSTPGTGFGSLNQQNQNSLFGSSTATGFGTNNTASNSLFGQPQQTTGSLFGSAPTQPQSSVFGTSTANSGKFIHINLNELGNLWSIY